MSQKLPLFSPSSIPTPTPNPRRSSTELRFSRWNNANADRFSAPRPQDQIEDELRRHRRHTSAARILQDLPPSAAPSSPASKSFGTPSAPSAPSIPGKKSKYSKPPENPSRRTLARAVSKVSLPAGPPEVSVGENGVSYLFEGAPFEFQYSYTETPRVRPLALREPTLAPFATAGAPRPWTGRAPNTVQVFEESSQGFGVEERMCGVVPRDEVLGDDEVKELIEGCVKSKKQLNMGRDGLIHNMLENIHAHWKRQKVCKIKCKGVCTVDMDNVRQQLEEKTGGKIIYSKGGVIFLYRGSNYNHRTRPRYPLMLWKPITPVYPRLVQQVPEGLTLEEATNMRKKGRQLPPICHLAKNGMYADLVKQVKEAFEVCELARINCKDIKKGDCRKIGAKLRDIVPCILVSFEDEHILVWRGKDWKPSVLPPGTTENTLAESKADVSSHSDTESLSGIALNMLDSDPQMSADMGLVIEDLEMSVPSVEYPQHETFDNSKQTNAGEQRVNVKSQGAATLSSEFCDSRVTPHNSESSIHSGTNFSPELCLGLQFPNKVLYASVELEKGEGVHDGERKEQLLITVYDDEDARLDSSVSEDNLELQERDMCSNIMSSSKTCLEEVMDLLNQAVASGAAVVLDNNALFDSDFVYEKSVILSMTAPLGLKFKHKIEGVNPETT